MYESLCIYWKWPPKLKKLQLILSIASCFLIHLCIGLPYSYGNLLPYVVSYIRAHSHPSDLQMTDAVYIYAGQYCMISVGILSGGLLVPRLGPRVVTLIGGGILASGVGLSYFTLRVSFWALLVTFGLMCGLGVGVAYIGPVICAMNWLPKWKGVASAVVTSGIGLSPLLYNVAITGYVNPHNLSPQPPITDYTPVDIDPYFTQDEVLDRVPSMFIVVFACCLSLLLVGSVFLVNPHPSYAHTEDQDDDDTNTHSSSSVQQATDSKELLPLFSQKSATGEGEVYSHTDNDMSSSKPDTTPLKMLCTVTFYFFWIKLLIGFAIIEITVSLYKTFGFDLVTRDDLYLTIVGSVSSIFNMLGRFILGLLEDFFDGPFAMAFQSAIMSFFLLTLYATSAGGEVMYFIWICGIYFCSGGYFSLYPTAVANRYGARYLSINYGIVNTSTIVGAIVAAVFSQFLINLIDWYGAFMFLGGLSFIDFILSVLLPYTT